MGNGNWSSTAWDSYSRATSTKSRRAIFTSQGLHEDDWASLILIEAALDSDPEVAGGAADEAPTWVRAGGSGITAIDEAPPTEVDPRRPGE